jgi:hypothetical protein
LRAASACTRASVPSVEQSSTTMISRMRSMAVWSSTLCIAASIVPSWL